MEKKETILQLANRMNEIEKEIYCLELEYNKIIEELKRRMPHLKDDVNLQLKEPLDSLIDRLINETYQDDLGEYTRIYPLNQCCRERLNVVKKKVRKYD